MANNDGTDAFQQCKQFLIAQTPAKLTKNDLKEHELLHLINDELPIQFKFLFEQLKVSSDESRLIVVDTLAIWFLRVSQFLSNKQKRKWDTSTLSQLLKSDLLTFTNCHFIFEYVIDFWNDGSNALLNALRDLFHKFLIVLKLIYDKTDLNELFIQWMDQIMEISSTLRVQYYLIETLAVDTDMFHILEKRPDFIKESLQLMSSESLSTPIGKCLVHLLINIYQFHFQSNLDKLEEWYTFWKSDTMYFLHLHKYTKPLNLYLLTPLFKQMPSDVFTDFISHLNTKETDPSILLSLLKIGQELGINDEPFHNDQLISIQTLETLLDIDEYKLPAFELLTTSKKKSKIIYPYILEIIKVHLHNFFVDSDLETRNYFISAFKSMILRIRDSCYSLQRDVTKLKLAKKFPQEQEAKLQQIEQYQHFITWLFQFLKTQLIPGIQYQRCLMSLSIISILIDSGLDPFVVPKDVDKQNNRSWPYSLNILNDRTLLRLLLDNLVSPVNDIRTSTKLLLSQAYNSNKVVKDTIHSMVNKETLSRKATENMNAYQNTEAGATIEMFLFDISSNQLQLINEQLELLHSENMKTKEYPLENIVNPISGYYISLAMFLNNLNLNAYPKDEIDKILQRTISEIVISWDISKDIMCHDSSDGLLPKKYLKCTLSDQTITSYAFRSVKESSRLLEVLVSKFTYTTEQMKQIGDLLILQLFTIRHSGCFQAVLPTFRTFCMKCRQVAPDQLKTWLDDILESLEVKTQHITRRSGGLPFLITNILATETSKDRPELKYVFDKLLNILKTVSEMEHQDKLDLPQINAFNCIKAIFIESKLSQACTPYFPIALEYSLQYFKSDIWALRNCSLMLFTSLQNRIFGKLGKNISARLFFTKYDGIDKLLLQILQKSVDHNNENERDMESIILVLSILMCLKQTPGYNGLTPFVTNIVKCLDNRNWKIRDMAARTLAALVDDTHMDILPLMENCGIQSQNRLHGHLLAAKSVLLLNYHHLPSKIDDLIERLLNNTTEFITCNPSFVTIKAYIEVLSLLFSKYENTISTKRKREVVSTVGNYFIQHFLSKNDINGSQQLCVSTVLRFLFINETKENIITLVQLGLESNLYEVQLEAVRYLEANGHQLQSDSEELHKISGKLIERLFNKKSLVTLKPSIIKSLNALPNSKIDFEGILEFFYESNSEACRLATIEYLGDCVENNDHVERAWDVVEKYCTDSTNEMFRMAALNCLINCSKKIPNIKVIIQIYDFLQDDDSDIRELASEYLNPYINKNGSVTMSRTSDTTARSVGNFIIENFDHAEIFTLCVSKLKEFFQESAIYSHREQFEGLFEIEKDNQFRSDIEQCIRLIQMIKKSHTGHTPSIVQFVTEEKSNLLKFLKSNNIVDEPLGWMHSGDVLSRIVILRRLVSTFLPADLDSFDISLKEHKTHQLVFEYEYM